MLVVSDEITLPEESKKYVSTVEVTDLKYITNSSGEIEVKATLNKTSGDKEKIISSSKDFNTIIDSPVIGIGDKFTITSDSTAEVWKLLEQNKNTSKQIDLRTPVEKCPVCNAKAKANKDTNITKCTNHSCISRKI